VEEERAFDGLPDGRIDAIYLHWTGDDEQRAFDSYHFCVVRQHGRLRVVRTHDLRENMRDIREDPSAPYAAHTFGRNSYAAGLAIAGMRGANPHDFGPYPLRDDAVDALCRTIAKLAARYAIPIEPDRVMTHAEAALADGYFGLDPIEQRWDLARLQPDPRPLDTHEARVTGDILRHRARLLLRHDR